MLVEDQQPHSRETGSDKIAEKYLSVANWPFSSTRRTQAAGYPATIEDPGDAVSSDIQQLDGNRENKACPDFNKCDFRNGAAATRETGIDVDRSGLEFRPLR